MLLWNQNYRIWFCMQFSVYLVTDTVLNEVNIKTVFFCLKALHRKCAQLFKV